MKESTIDRTLAIDVQNAFSVLEGIEKTSSRLEKEQYLSDNDSEVLRTLLIAAYDPYTQYFIKKLPKISGTPMTTWDNMDLNYVSFLSMLNSLNKREITGNTALDVVKGTLIKMSADERKWYSRVLQKDLKIGVAVATINKVFPALIPTFECSLAEPVTDATMDKLLPSLFVMDGKLDGMRIFAEKDKNGVSLKSRNGKLVFGFDELEEAINDQLEAGYVHDGELMSVQFFMQTLLDDDLAAAFRDLITKPFAKETGKTGVIYCIFDRVIASEFHSQTCSQPYSLRKALLEDSVKGVELKHIMLLPFSKLLHKSNPADREEMMRIYEQYLTSGYEGAMIKDVNALYQYKRSKAVLKMKPTDTIDLEVTSVIEGDGKYTGMMGAVTVKLEEQYTVHVGSGFTDDQRLAFFLNPNDILGKTIEIHYQGITNNQEGGRSLRFPRFKCVREDK